MPRTSLAQYLSSLTEAKVRQAGAGLAIAQIGEYARTYPEGDDLPALMRRHLEAALARIRVLAPRVPDFQHALAIELMVLGKLGRIAEAIRHAESAYRRRPAWDTAAAAASAHRRADHVEAALRFYRLAARHDRRDVSALLDIADYYFHTGDWRTALRTYEAVLRRERHHPFAGPSANYCRYRINGDRRWLQRLRAQARPPEDQCGVDGALAALLGEPPRERRRRRALELLEMAD